jgi:hypothetical protein
MLAIAGLRWLLPFFYARTSDFGFLLPGILCSERSAFS